MVKKTPYLVNSKLSGIFYELDSGRKLYLAHRTPGQILKPKMAWCIEEAVLRRCEEQGIDAVGVIVRDGNKALFYLTHRKDFYDTAKSFPSYKKGVYRALPAKLFTINPANCAETIARRSTIGR